MADPVICPDCGKTVVGEDPNPEFMLAVLTSYRKRRGWAESNMRHWSGLCGRFPQNYGIRMPENLTQHALMMGVLAS